MEVLIKSLESRYQNLWSHKLFGNLDVLDSFYIDNFSATDNEKVNEKFTKIIEVFPANIIIDKEPIVEEFGNFKL